MNQQAHNARPSASLTRHLADTRDSSEHRQTPSVRRLLHPGHHLFHAGDQCENAYLVRTGSLKSYRIDANGEEQFIGLHGAGDVLGFDAILGKPASRSVVAMETCSLQVLGNPSGLLGHADIDGTGALILEGLCREVERLTRRLKLERHPSERRMAEFLLDYSQRQRERGLEHRELVLPISRRSLAHYLGLAPETVSRTLSCFQSQEILRVANRKLTIVDPAALETIANEQ